MGDRIRAIAKAFAGKLVRVRPSAANTPKAVAITVTGMAMTKLADAANRQDWEVNKSSYQRVEIPAKGKVKKGSELNDNGITAKSGAAR